MSRELYGARRASGVREEGQGQAVNSSFKEARKRHMHRNSLFPQGLTFLTGLILAGLWHGLAMEVAMMPRD
jgi:hypothetical protein